MNNENREYKFKYMRFSALTFAVCMIVSFPLLFFFTNIIEPTLNRLQYGEVLFIVIFLGGMLMIWAVIYALTESKGEATLYKSYVEIELKNKKYTIRYREIKSVSFFNSWGIHLNDGSDIHIAPSYRLIFRDPLSKFMKALQKEINNHSSSKNRRRR